MLLVKDEAENEMDMSKALRRRPFTPARLEVEPHAHDRVRVIHRARNSVPHLLFEKRRFRFRGGNGDEWFWSCRRPNCQRRLVTDSKFSRWRTYLEHSPVCLEDELRMEGDYIVGLMIRAAEQSTSPIKDVMASVLRHYEPGSYRLPDGRPNYMMDKLKAARSWHSGPRAPEPSSADWLPENATETTDGKRFLLHKSDLKRTKRVVILASDLQLQLMARTHHWLLRTQRVSTKESRYLVTMSGAVQNGIVPLAWALVQGKSCEIYRKVLAELRGALQVRNLQPIAHSINIDLECTAQLALEHEFPLVVVYYGFAPFRRVLFERALSGTVGNAELTGHTLELVAQLCSLPFVPVEAVGTLFNTISSNHKLDQQPLLEYFRVNFLVEGGKTEPRFHPRYWNLHERLKDMRYTEQCLTDFKDAAPVNVGLVDHITRCKLAHEAAVNTLPHKQQSHVTSFSSDALINRILVNYRNQGTNLFTMVAQVAAAITAETRGSPS